MKVLVVSSKYPPEYAGSGLRAHNTYRRLACKFGIKFDVMASSITTNKNRRYILDGVSVKVIANKFNKRIPLKDSDNNIERLTKGLLNRLYIWCDYWREALPTFFYLLRNHSRYNIMHIFGNVAVTSAAISYAKITKKPIIIELVNLVDNPYQPEPKLLSLLFNKGFPKQALIVCISERLRKVCKNHGYRNEQIWCRPNPVDENRFFYAPNKKRISGEPLLNLEAPDVLLLYLAKFMPQKNQGFMIEVMSYLPDNYKLILAGPLIGAGPLLKRDREYYQFIVDTIRTEHLENRVKVIPEFIKTPDGYIRAADVFVMPSTREAFSTPLLEALACGVPVVANEIPGVFDQWIKDGTNGYICKLDHKEWAKKIMMAAKINKDTMKQASEEVLKVASTEVIDQEYYRRLLSLIKRYDKKTSRQTTE